MTDIGEPGQTGDIGRDFHAEGIKRLGVLDTEIVRGVHVAIFDGKGIMVDVTGTDGGGILTNASGTGNLGLKDLIPEEAQIRIDPKTGERIEPEFRASITLKAFVKIIPIEEVEPARFIGSSDLAQSQTQE